MKPIILTGLARSGKDATADYLALKYGYNKYVLSDVLAEILRKNGKAVNKANMSALGDKLRKEEGMEAVARRLMERVRGERVVIVGARSMAEVDFLKRKLRGAILVKVDAKREKRFERRSSEDPNITEEFFARDEIDLKNKGFEKVLKHADFVVENNGALWELHRKIDELTETFI